MKYIYIYITLLLLLFISDAVHAQQYFKFIYSNVPVVYGSDPYSITDAMGWLYSGQIQEDPRCNTCTYLVEDAKIKRVNMDSLHNEYWKIYPKEIIQKNYAPYVERNVKDEQNSRYKIFTFYQSEGDNLVPLFQVKRYSLLVCTMANTM